MRLRHHKHAIVALDGTGRRDIAHDVLRAEGVECLNQLLLHSRWEARLTVLRELGAGLKRERDFLHEEVCGRDGATDFAQRLKDARAHELRKVRALATLRDEVPVDACGDCFVCDGVDARELNGGQTRAWCLRCGVNRGGSLKLRDRNEVGQGAVIVRVGQGVVIVVERVDARSECTGVTTRGNRQWACACAVVSSSVRGGSDSYATARALRGCQFACSRLKAKLHLSEGVAAFLIVTKVGTQRADDGGRIAKCERSGCGMLGRIAVRVTNDATE